MTIQLPLKPRNCALCRVQNCLSNQILIALGQIELRSKVPAERSLLAKVAEDTWECMQEEAEPRTGAQILEDVLNENGIILPKGASS